VKARLNKKRTWAFLGILFLIGFVLALAIEAYTDTRRLKTQYPVMVYKGPKEPPDVHFSKGKPRDWIPFSSVPRAVVGAILISEDGSFYRHGGYDPAQIREALKVDLAEGRFARGASTITQQVVKNVFLTRNKSLWRKIKELIWAVALEKTLRKSKILEIYLNVAELGQGLYGIAPAAHYYFDRPASDLGAKEGAFLAMLLPSPKKYSLSFRERRLTPFAKKSVDRILRRMAQAGYITHEEAQSLAYSPLSFEGPEPDLEEDESNREEN
jgi:monofunctional biosynthetic peptidoglycan transglycosylase